MDDRKELLLKSAARLYSLGVELEAAREAVRRLVENKADYDSPELEQAVKEFNEQKRLWDSLEREHIQLRNELLGEQNRNV